MYMYIFLLPVMDQVSTCSVDTETVMWRPLVTQKAGPVSVRWQVFTLRKQLN